MEEHKVYHIHELDNNELSYGYVGVTNNVQNRIRQHRCTGMLAGSRVLTVLCVGNKEYCLGIEFKLRPISNKGLNKSPGGRYGTRLARTVANGRPSRATGRISETQFKPGRIPHNINTGQHYILTDPKGNEYYVISLCIFCRAHNLTPQNLRKVAKGERNYHKGWKAIKVLSESARTRTR